MVGSVLVGLCLSVSVSVSVSVSLSLIHTHPNVRKISKRGIGPEEICLGSVFGGCRGVVTWYTLEASFSVWGAAGDVGD